MSVHKKYTLMRTYINVMFVIKLLRLKVFYKIIRKYTLAACITNVMFVVNGLYNLITQKIIKEHIQANGLDIQMLKKSTREHTR